MRIKRAGGDKTGGEPIVVADLGCGEAKIASELDPDMDGSRGFRVHSFDLVAANKHVTACDISHVPLTVSSVDVVVICLALMGTNFKDFLTEAFRILKPGASLMIAEVSSRFQAEASKDGEERDEDDTNSKPASNTSIEEAACNKFIRMMSDLGFTNLSLVSVYAIPRVLVLLYLDH